jgi:hypothetical protein
MDNSMRGNPADDHGSTTAGGCGGCGDNVQAPDRLRGRSTRPRSRPPLMPRRPLERKAG